MSCNPVYKGVKYNTLDEVAKVIEQELLTQINYKLKAVGILSNLTDKQKQEFNKLNKGSITIEQLVNNIQIPKEQKQLVIDSYNGGNKTPEQLAIDIASKMSYSVEVKTATIRNIDKAKEFKYSSNAPFQIDNSIYTIQETDGIIPEITFFRDNIEIERVEYFEAKDRYYETHADNIKSETTTQHYSNLTVPGGTNYTENRIITPQIVPSIKGHAQFAEKEDIGWFRSDDKSIGGEIEEFDNSSVDFDENGNPIVNYSEGKKTTGGQPTKTRRILELQSDLFQKGRDKKGLVSKSFEAAFEDPEIGHLVTQGMSMEDIQQQITKDRNNPQNQFLQLLNKDNNWVTFFIKSIIQDSAKKGYEKVLFPKGETAAKIEGHETIAEEIRIYENTINKADEYFYNGEYISPTLTGNHGRYNIIAKTKEDFISKLEGAKQELKSQGIEKLKPIEAFYEIKVGNILEKQFGKDNVKTITDEFGNQWREIDLNNERVRQETDIIYNTVNEFSTTEPNTDTTKIGLDLQVKDALVTSLLDIVNSINFQLYKNGKRNTYEEKELNIVFETKKEQDNIQRNVIKVLERLISNKNLGANQRDNLKSALIDVSNNGILWQTVKKQYTQLYKRNILDDTLTASDTDRAYTNEAESNHVGQTKNFENTNTNNKLQVTPEVKALIGRYPKIKSKNETTGEVEYVINQFTGLPEYLNFNDVYPTLSRIFANKLDVEDMLSELYQKASYFDISLEALYSDLLQDANISAQLFNTLAQTMLDSIYNKYDEVGGIPTIDDARKVNNPTYRVANRWVNQLISNVETYFNYKESKKNNEEYIGDTTIIDDLNKVGTKSSEITIKLNDLIEQYIKANTVLDGNKQPVKIDGKIQVADYSDGQVLEISKLLSEKLSLIGINIPVDIFVKDITRLGANGSRKRIIGETGTEGLRGAIDFPVHWVVNSVKSINNGKITKENFKDTKFYGEFKGVNLLADMYQYYDYDEVQLTNANPNGDNIYIIQKPFFLADLFNLFKRSIDGSVGSSDAKKKLSTYLTQLSQVKRFQYSNWLWSDIKTTADTIEPLNNGFINYDYKIYEETGKKVFKSINEEFLNNFRLSYYDGAKNTSTMSGFVYSEQSTKDWINNFAIMFDKGIAGNRESDNNKLMTIPMIIPSDSRSMYVLTAPKVKLSDDEAKVLKDLKVSNIEKVLADGESVLFQAVHNVLLGEIQQIQDNFNLLFDYDINKPVEERISVKKDLNREVLQKYKHYTKSNTELLDKNNIPTGFVFKFLNMVLEDGTSFNQYLENKGIIGWVGQREASADMLKAAREFTAKFIYQQIQYSDTLDLTNSKIVLSSIKPELVLNTYVANIEQQNLFVGNIYEYKDYQDTNKRAKQLFAPGTRYDINAINAGLKDDAKKDYYKEIVLKSIKKESLSYDKIYSDVEKAVIKENPNLNTKQIKEKVEAIVNGYKNIDTTDAQAYITFNEAIRRLKGLGRFNIFKDLIQRIETVAAKPKKDLNLDDISLMLSPFKNFYYSREYQIFQQKQIDVNGNIIQDEIADLISKQDKNSEFILFPNFIKGTQLELLNKYMTDNGIDQVSFDSAVKVGVQSVSNINENNIEEVIKEDAKGIEIRYYKNLRLQLDMPEHHEDTKNLLGTQIKRLILANISDDMEFDMLIPTGEIGNNNTPVRRNVKGKELREHYFNLLSANIREDSNKLLTRLGAAKDKDGNWKTDELGYIKLNNNNLSEILIGEVEARNMAENYKVGLKVDAVTGYFNLPLYINGMIDKYQAIFTSLFTNSVVNQKIPGSHNVQVSGTFFNTKGFDKQTLSELETEIEKTGDYEKNGIQYTEEQLQKQKERGHNKLMCYGEGDKLVLECIMPPHSSKFYEKSKRIDINRVPKEILDMIGYRIPTDAKHSMIVLKVVGWSSKVSASTVILADEVITMTGSDFDIDTVYFISKHFRKNSNNTFAVDEYYDFANSEENFKTYVFNNYRDEYLAANEKRKEEVNKLYETINRSLGGYKSWVTRYKNTLTNNSETFNEAVNDLLQKRDNVEISIKQINDEYNLATNVQYDLEGVSVSKNEELKIVQNLSGTDEFETLQDYIDDLSSTIEFLNGELEQINNQIISIDELKDEVKSEIKGDISNARKRLQEARERKGIESYKQYEELYSNMINSFKDKYWNEFTSKSINEQNSRKQRDNRILDIYRAILLHPDFKKERITPAEYGAMQDAAQDVNNVDKYGALTDELKKEAKETGIDKTTLPTGKFHPATFAGQVKFRELNMDGTVLKGIAANANSFNSVGQIVRFQLPDEYAYIGRYEKTKINKTFKELEKKYGEGNVEDDDAYWQITHGRIAHNADGSFDNIFGIPITEHAAEALTNILDIVKFPLAANLNIYTFPVFISIVSQGVPIEQATWLVTQQSIRDLYQNWLIGKGVVTEEGVGLEQELTTTSYQTKLYFTGVLGVKDVDSYIRRIKSDYDKSLEKLREHYKKQNTIKLDAELFNEWYETRYFKKGGKDTEEQYKATQDKHIKAFGIGYDTKKLYDYGFRSKLWFLVNTGGVKFIAPKESSKQSDKDIWDKIQKDIFKVDIKERVAFSTRELIDLHKITFNLNNGKANNESVDTILKYYREQLKVLESFKIYKNGADIYQSGVTVLGIDKLEVGPTLSTITGWIRSALKFGGIKIIDPYRFDGDTMDYIGNDKSGNIIVRTKGANIARDSKTGLSILESVFPTLEYDGVKLFEKYDDNSNILPTPKSTYSPIETMYNYAHKPALNIGSSYFITEHKVVKDAIRIIEKDGAMQFDDLATKDFNNFVLAKFLTQYDNKLFDISELERGYLLGLNEISSNYNPSRNYADFASMSVANKIKYYQNVFKDRLENINHIANYLEPKTTTNDIDKFNHQSLLFNNTKNDPLKDDMISRNMLYMYEYGDVFDKDLIRSLIKYTVLTTDYSYGQNSITKLIPNEILVKEGVGTFFNEDFIRNGINNIQSDELAKEFIQRKATNQKYVVRVFDHQAEKTQDEDGKVTYEIPDRLPNWSAGVKYNEDGTVKELVIPRKKLAGYVYLGGKYKRIVDSTYIYYEHAHYEKRTIKDKEGNEITKNVRVVDSAELYEDISSKRDDEGNKDDRSEDNRIYVPIEKRSVGEFGYTIFEKNKVGYIRPSKEQVKEVENTNGNVASTKEQSQTNIDVDKIYSDINKYSKGKTKSENVVLPEDFDMKYSGSTFWSEIVPEARGNYENSNNPILIAYRGNKTKTFAENYKSNTLGNPFEVTSETGTDKEKGIKATKKFMDWLITGNNYGNENATEQYRNAIVNDFKNGKWKSSTILYYQEKGYATHATVIDYLANEFNWNVEQQTLFETANIYTVNEIIIDNVRYSGLKNTIPLNIIQNADKQIISDFINGLYKRGTLQYFEFDVMLSELNSGKLLQLNSKEEQLLLDNRIMENISKSEFEFRFAYILSYVIAKNKGTNLVNMTVNDMKKLFGINSNIFDKLFTKFVEYNNATSEKDILKQNQVVQSFVSEC